MDVEIQPWYIVDKGRKSVKNEIKAMRDIANNIRRHPSTKAILNDVRYVQVEDCEPDKEITDAYNVLHEKYSLGSQYDFLARFAKQNNLRLEVSLEKSVRSKALNTLKGETKFVRFEDGEYSVERIDGPKSSKEGNLVFSNMDFPSSLINMTKEDEVAKAIEMGLGETIKHTWFCHNPILGYPCGHCNPCKDALNEGMEWRVPLNGRLLYWIVAPVQKIISKFGK